MIQRLFHVAAFVVLVLFLAGCGPSSESRRLIGRLRSRNVAERLKAVAEAQSQRHAGAPVRTELLRMFEADREVPIVRGCAGMALGSLHDPRIVPAVLERLPNSILNIGKPARPQNLDAYLLGKTLLAYGPDSLQPLSALLRDPRKEVVCWTLMHHGFYRHSDRALEVLAHYAEDRDVILRQAASFGLSLLAHKRAEELVLRHIADPDADVRYNLAWALLNYGSSLGVRPLEAQLAKEREPRVRQEIAKALAVMKTRPVAPAAARPPQNPPRRSEQLRMFHQVVRLDLPLCGLPSPCRAAAPAWRAAGTSTAARSESPGRIEQDIALERPSPPGGPATVVHAVGPNAVEQPIRALGPVNHRAPAEGVLRHLAEVLWDEVS